MSSTTPASDLLFRWAEARRLGQSVTAEELCRDSPERLTEIKQQIQLLEVILPLLSGAVPSTVGDTQSAPDTIPMRPANAASRYRAVRPHASGGLGEVLVAEDDELNRPVALKRIRECYAFDPAYRRRFLREAEVTARLQHPGIVPVYGLTSDEFGRPCYAMRFIEGEPLADAVDRLHATGTAAPRGGEESVAFRQLLQRFVQVCNAVAYAHSRGVLHRDLKPANIMLGRYGETLVVDWGLAKPVVRSDSEGPGAEESLTPSGDGSGEKTELGHVIGTPAFMSMEQAHGAWDVVGPAADIFSLGATLYTILTGQPPYPGNAVVALDHARRCDFAPPRQVKTGTPPALEAVCLRAMACQPKDRYQTALELATELERWLAGEPVAAYPEPWPDRARRWMQRHRPLVTGATAALVVGAVSLGTAAVLLGAANEHLRLARGQAEQERDIAKAQKRRTREALDAMTSRQALGWLTAQKELLPQQRVFLERALPYYQQFAAEAADDAESRSLLAGATYRVAQIYEALGRTSEAEKTYRKAVALYNRLTGDSPDVAEHRWDLAASLNSLGTMLYQLHQGQKAEAVFRQALPYYEQLIDRDHAEPKYRYGLAVCLDNLGILLHELGAHFESEKMFHRAIAIVEQLTSDAPNVPEYRLSLATNLINSGNLLRDLDGRRAEAMVRYRQAAGQLEQLAREDDGVPEYRDRLAGTLSNLGTLLNDPKQRIEAEDTFQRARSAYERLITEAPGVPRYRSGLAGVLVNWGVVLQRSGENQEAADFYRRAAKLLERLAVDYVDVPEYRSRNSATLNNLVYVLRDLGQPEEAEAVCREAVELQERLAGDVHAVLNDTIDLGCSYCTLANLLRARQPQAALEWYTKAVARLGPVVEAEPRLATARQYLRTGHLGRAETLAQLGRHAEAVRAWDRTIELDDGGNRDWLRFRRANDLARAGDVVRALAEVDQLTGAAGASAEALYDGACVLATVAAQSTPDADGHAARAVRLLRGAIVRGFADVTQMLNDTDLDPLRTRPDYVDLLWDLADQPPIWR